jgi:crossover junction endodeoxyribonuclease RuvC
MTFVSRSSRRSLWTAKVLGKLPARDESANNAAQSKWTQHGRAAFHGVVLGIDPSLRGTGLALLEFRPQGTRLLFSETVKVNPKLSFAVCLGKIFGSVQAALAAAPVRHVAIEQTIYVQNFQTAQILGAARGAAIAAAACAGVEVFEYAPLRVKQAVVGLGRASKEQVARTVAQHLAVTASLPTDEADAAATALCHAFTWRE